MERFFAGKNPNRNTFYQEIGDFFHKVTKINDK
jgi:hypothetical protein